MPSIFFYSSETNINNFSMLKGEFDAYLAGQGGYRFQPFSKRVDFERFVLAEKHGLILVSSWHFRLLRQKVALDPVMVGVAAGQSTHRRVLSARNGIEGVAALRGQRIASAGSKDFTLTVLREILGPGQDDLLNSFKILVVPKDIDALMAVSFGMAKAALTAEGSVRKLAKINPKQHALLGPLAVSEGALLPVVAVLNSERATDRDLLTVIEGMGEDAEGAERLRMLGLDRLKRLNESERGLLLR